jgi:AraC family transcriptional regulator, transcriptional activator of pobA
LLLPLLLEFIGFTFGYIFCFQQIINGNMTESIIPTESLLQFYQRTNQEIPGDLLNNLSGPGHFNVKQTGVGCGKTPYNRRDYFKICLSSGDGKGMLRYQDKEYLLEGPCLMFTNPSVSASIEVLSLTLDRFYCLFDFRFIEGFIRSDLQLACPLFNSSLPPVIQLKEEEFGKLKSYLKEQQSLLQSDYTYKWDMIRGLLLLLLHEGIRLQQSQSEHIFLVKEKVVKDFFALLNEQFPADSPSNPLTFLSPSFFAERLFVHVNHLNSVVKRVTGKTTQGIIRERIIYEAKTLLQNTDWSIGEIAYTLGFEYPSHFNKYFKSDTAITPIEFRSKTTTRLYQNL